MKKYHSDYVDSNHQRYEHLNPSNELCPDRFANFNLLPPASTLSAKNGSMIPPSFLISCCPFAKRDQFRHDAHRIRS